MQNKSGESKMTGNWIGVGTAIGAVVFALTREAVWIGVGVAVGAALDWRVARKQKNDIESQ